MEINAGIYTFRKFPGGPQFGILFFITCMPYCVRFVTSQLQIGEETQVPSENHCLTPSHWLLSPGWIQTRAVVRDSEQPGVAAP